MVTRIFYAELSDGSIRRIEAPSRKMAVEIARATGYQVYKVTKDGGTIQYRGVPHQKEAA